MSERNDPPEAAALDAGLERALKAVSNRNRPYREALGLTERSQMSETVKAESRKSPYEHAFDQACVVIYGVKQVFGSGLMCEDLPKHAADLMNETRDLRTENQRLREALERIAAIDAWKLRSPYDGLRDAAELAREALKPEGGAE